ncbi:COMPASS-like H3K4 histone methylase component WDR5B {ECO:0000303/PubMed:19567704} Short=AtWDR5B {ECO:0000303/PubMed:19567704} [Serendipita indica DSM 11827]|nr:COMPASS-like H3K4 histone methylase component WDR5B {ECO:0000303/PubMed:19567704} Short=AtWDR5B {ECO:0000303/PubMed:19567704} [Serendipita indica DSM 11827]
MNPQDSSSSANLPSRKRGQVYNTASTGLDFVANVAEASDILSPLKAACKATKSILDVLQTVEDNQEDWDDLTRRLEEYMFAIDNQIDSFEKYPADERVVDEAFRQPLIHYVELLESFQETVAHHRHKRSRSAFASLSGIGKVKLDAGLIRKFNRDIEDRHRQLLDQLSLFTAYRIQVIERKIEATKAKLYAVMASMEANTEVTKSKVETILSDIDTAAILQLPMAAFVASSVHAPCLQGTRQAVLDKIRYWAVDDMLGKPIFWLCDIAGSGKSSVAMSAAASWRAEGTLGAQFFFSMASAEASNTEKLCSTISRELAHHIPALSPHIADAVKRSPAITRSSLGEQFSTLIARPLNHLDKRVIIVIDAIDECKSGSQRRELVETLAKGVRESKNLKIFMTSRPDPVIEAVLKELSIKEKLEDRLHDPNHSDNIDDIGVYVHQSLYRLLSQDRRQRLVEKANGLFIWASTACRMLTSETSWSSPNDTYDHLISMDQPGAIDDVYRLVFERTDPTYYTVMCATLALLLAAYEPLTVDDLDDLLKHARVRGTSKALLQNLGSVLSVDVNSHLIQFRHPTFVEYLRRCTIAPATDNGDRMYLNLANAHGQAASWCFRNLKSRTEGLKFNICQIESSFLLNRQIPDLDFRVSKFIPRRLRYASSHWLFHLAGTDDNWQRTLKKELEQIIEGSYVLYWAEVLSLIGGVPRAIAGLRAITHHLGIEKENKGRMTEIRRFLMAFSVPIQDSATHIYVSALAFTPRKSMLHKERVRRYGSTLRVIRGVEETYPDLPRTLRGHEDQVNAVGTSPDGSRIVSGSDDWTIRLWDADTGQPLGEPLRGHEGPVRAVGFSPDGSRIVSGSDDKTIRLWDADTGQPLGEPLRGHEDWVRAVGFSPDGSRIVSGSDDKTIRLWDADTGQPLGEPLRGHESWVWAVGFSPDGSRIVSGSDDKTIRLWDADTGQPLGEPLRGHEGGVWAVGFSPDGSRIVSGSSDKTIRLWDADTGQPLGEPLRGHEGGVWAVGFSPDGSRIVSGSSDKTIRLWDADTGQPLGEPLRDGSRIVSGSDDKTIRLWDADTGQPLGEPLRDGSRIVSGSFDKTIRLWDADTGQPLGEPLRGHEGGVWAVGFSPDGSRIVSGSDDKTIRLWDADTGQPLGEPLRGHEGGVWAVGFSPDGSRIVSGSSDKTIRLWDADTGQPLGEPLRGHEGGVWAVGFSPDGSRIVSGSSDKTIRLWDADTGQPLGEPLRGHESWVWAVGFSPDGSRIVSGSDDKTIRLWDADTGQPLGEPLRGHEGGVWAVGFSPDGSRIVSGSDDKTIRLWDADTGQLLGEAPPDQLKDGINVATISPDGSQRVSGLHDGTVRVWDMHTGAGAHSLQIQIPGFTQCSLLHDGWVQSSGNFLFWVPPENRYGLRNQDLRLTMPTSSPTRATKLDFTNFQCGLSWTNVRRNINQ